MCMCVSEAPIVKLPHQKTYDFFISFFFYNFFYSIQIQWTHRCIIYYGQYVPSF